MYLFSNRAVGHILRQHLYIKICKINTFRSFQASCNRIKLFFAEYTVISKEFLCLFIRNPPMTAPFARILIYAQHICKTEIRHISFYHRRLAYSQDTSALLCIASEFFQYPAVVPLLSAAPCASCKACIDNYIIVRKLLLPYILKINVIHLYRPAGQCLIDMYQIILPGLMEMAGKCPGACFSPGSQHSHMKAQKLGLSLLMKSLYGSEFICSPADIFHKIRIIL